MPVAPAGHIGGIDEMHPAVRTAMVSLRRALLRYAFVPLLLALLLGALGYAIGATAPQTSTAAGKVYLSSEGPFDPFGGLAQPSADRFLETQSEVLRTPAQLGTALATTGDRRTPADIDPLITVTTALGSDNMTLTMVDDNGARAGALVNAITGAYRSLRQRQVVDATTRAVGLARGDLTRVVDIQTRAAAYGDGIALIEQAEVTSTGDNALRNLALGALLGLALGVALVAIRQQLSARRRQLGRRLEAVLGSPCLGQFPRLSAGPGRFAVPLADRFSAAEVSRLAVTTVLAAHHVGARRLLVAGSTKRLGATTVAANLALGAAIHGEHVVVLAAPSRGRPADTELVDLPVAATGSFWGREEFFLGPEARLAVRQISESDSALRPAGEADRMVLLDPGVALDDARCLRLSASVDGVVLVCAPHQDPEALAELRHLLALAHVPLLGFVVNRGAHKRHRRSRARPRVASPRPAPDPGGRGSVQLEKTARR